MTGSLQQGRHLQADAQGSGRRASQENKEELASMSVFFAVQATLLPSPRRDAPTHSSTRPRCGCCASS